MNLPSHRWLRSLQFRLLLATLVAVLLAVVLSGVVLQSLFREHVLRQFGATLTTQLEQVIARLEFDAQGQPSVDSQTLSDPRWSRPLSGLYWQIDPLGPSAGAGSPRTALRSRSLWDNTLALPADIQRGPAPGALQLHEIQGPGGAPLVLVERSIKPPNDEAMLWRVMVAGDLHETDAAVQRFKGVLGWSLLALLALLVLAAGAQVAVGLSPLRVLQRALADVQEGRAQRLVGRFPAEVQPLVDNFNGVLDRNAAVVARARTQAGNLAHAIKTPLAVMAQAAASAAAAGRSRPDAWAALVTEQVAMANRQVDWHLKRARVAAAQAIPGARVELAPVVAALVRVMDHVHAGRGVQVAVAPMQPDLAFAGELEDLQEMLGNLLDNACKWAGQRVEMGAVAVHAAAPGRLLVSVDDDGPGIEPERRDSVLARGARLDESVPGSGLGLAIVQELAALYGGQLRLVASERGGLRAELELPLAP